MASNRQTRANRRNAQKSTGPRTPEGKAKIRFNALKYGIHADQIVLPTENEDEWRNTFFNFHDEFAPRTPSQEALVYFMASAFWNTLRCQRAEHGIFILAQSDREALDQLSKTTGRTDEEMMGWCYQRMLGRHAPLPQILMYSDRLSRQFLRFLRELQKAPAPSAAQEPGQPTRKPPAPVPDLESAVPGTRSPVPVSSVPTPAGFRAVSAAAAALNHKEANAEPAPEPAVEENAKSNPIPETDIAVARPFLAVSGPTGIRAGVEFSEQTQTQRRTPGPSKSEDLPFTVIASANQTQSRKRTRLIRGPRTPFTTSPRRPARQLAGCTATAKGYFGLGRSERSFRAGHGRRPARSQPASFKLAPQWLPYFRCIRFGVQSTLRTPGY